MMGGAKREWMEAQERGWAAPERWVCSDCVSDAHLKQLINEAVESQECDYCGRTDEDDIAAPVEVIMPSIMGALTHYFAEPAGAGVPYESAEGGYAIEPTDTQDALLSLPLECNDELFEEVADAISSQNDAWVEAADGHWASEQKNLELIHGWKRFAHHVKHRQRYFFSAAPPEYGQDIEPSRLLPELGSVVSELKLISNVPSGSDLFRARIRSSSDTWPLDADNLGAPPPKKAAAGRMNPPGISYLYLALEYETALSEVFHGPPCSLAIGNFELQRQVRVLNLIDLPPRPSIYDHENLRLRELLIFLSAFVDAISSPVEKDGGEHIEYVPSQIVCEYFASVFDLERPLDGILYPSAVRPGGRNLVLFPNFSNREPFPHIALQGVEELNVETWADL